MCAVQWSRYTYKDPQTYINVCPLSRGFIPSGLFYEHACNKLMQSMCFHEAEKLNAGSHSKTFLKVTKSVSKSLGHASLPHKTSKTALGPKQPQPQPQLATGSTSLAQASTISISKAVGGAAGAGLGSGLLEEESQKDLMVSGCVCMFVCVCVYVCLCVCMFVCMCACVGFVCVCAAPH